MAAAPAANLVLTAAAASGLTAVAVALGVGSPVRRTDHLVAEQGPQVVEVAPGAIANFSGGSGRKQCFDGVVLSGKVEVYVKGGHFPKTKGPGDFLSGCGITLNNSWKEACSVAMSASSSTE